MVLVLVATLLLILLLLLHVGHEITRGHHRGHYHVHGVRAHEAAALVVGATGRGRRHLHHHEIGQLHVHLRRHLLLSGNYGGWGRRGPAHSGVGRPPVAGVAAPRIGGHRWRWRRHGRRRPRVKLGHQLFEPRVAAHGRVQEVEPHVGVVGRLVRQRFQLKRDFRVGGERGVNLNARHVLRRWFEWQPHRRHHRGGLAEVGVPEHGLA